MAFPMQKRSPKASVLFVIRNLTSAQIGCAGRANHAARVSADLVNRTFRFRLWTDRAIRATDSEQGARLRKLRARSFLFIAAVGP